MKIFNVNSKSKLVPTVLILHIVHTHIAIPIGECIK